MSYKLNELYFAHFVQTTAPYNNEGNDGQREPPLFLKRLSVVGFSGGEVAAKSLRLSPCDRAYSSNAPVAPDVEEIQYLNESLTLLSGDAKTPNIKARPFEDS